jgi:hypothetical protein
MTNFHIIIELFKYIVHLINEKIIEKLKISIKLKE